MKSLDFEAALELGIPGQCFSVLLFQLILKADSGNLEMLRKAYPINVKMVELYRTEGCPKRDGRDDFEALHARAYRLAYAATEKE